MLWSRSVRYCVVVAMASVSVCAVAQQKRPITAKDFDSWKSINGQALSRDGRWLAYGVFPQEGDGAVVIRDLKTGQEWREDAGELPPPAAADETADAPPPPRAVKIVFTQDGSHLAFLAYPRAEAVAKAKKNKSAKAEEELVVFDLAAGKAMRVAEVKSFQVPEKGDGYVAYQKYPPAAAGAGAEAPGADLLVDDEEDAQARGGRASAAGQGAGAQYGSTVVLLTLGTGAQREFADVLEYALGKDGKVMAYAVASAQAETDGVFTVATTGGDAKELVAGKAKYQHLVWDEKENALAFVGNPGDEAKKASYNLYLWKAPEAKAEVVAASATAGLPAGFVVNDHAALAFSKDGTRLFFGAAPPAPPAHATAIDEDKPSFDLWNWKDDAIPPAQKVRATADRNRSYRAAYLIGPKKVLQLADLSMTDIVLSDSGKYGIGVDDREYRAMTDYGGRISDSYLVDTETGKRTLLVKKHESAVRWSGDGKYAVIFDGKDWNTIAVPSGKTTNLTAKLPVKFWTEDYDSPSTPPAYGLAGWTRDDKYVLLYDHYDVWQVAPDGSSAVNLTQGMGRAQHLEFRYVALDREEGRGQGASPVIDPAKPLLLHAEDAMTHGTGFYTTHIGDKSAPLKLVMANEDFSNPIKAKDADVYVLTAQTYTHFPDLMVTDGTFGAMKKVSDANPQAAGLAFGTDELVAFENVDGVKLQGILYKPENFDTSKKYPMIVYLYEKLSQNVNHFVDPKPMDSINISYYVSNGYLVFTPDIVYTTGYPGQSALKCVMAGVNAMAAKRFVDEKNIGIQGHSWGGYQIAYMMTQTTRFKAAEDGAPVSDMISAYDGIRWGPGRPRQFQYEQTQSRIGGTPWQYPLRFIENSPIYMADKVQTPILIIANDADDAVPWYQGIEFFLALRRLGKEAYMFTYNGEPHHLRRRPNQKDYAARMAAYFDYELKGAPEPEWMVKGIPYLHTAEQAGDK